MFFYTLFSLLTKNKLFFFYLRRIENFKSSSNCSNNVQNRAGANQNRIPISKKNEIQSSEEESEEDEEEDEGKNLRDEQENDNEELEESNSLPKISEDEEEETPEARKFIKKVNKHPGIQIRNEVHDVRREPHEILGNKPMNKFVKRPVTASSRSNTVREEKPANNMMSNSSALMMKKSSTSSSGFGLNKNQTRPMTATSGKESMKEF